MSQDPHTFTSRRALWCIALALGCLPLLASVARAQAIVTTVAGNGVRGFAGDGGPATSAQFEYPAGLALDSAGNLYIADLFNNRVRKVTPQGTITTVAGDGRADLGPLGDGGPATSARIWYPAAVLPDSAGNLFIAPCSEWWIRKVDTNGIINRLAPNSDFLLQLGCDYNYIFPDPALNLAEDPSGNLFVPEPHANQIRKFTPEGASTIVAGTGVHGFSGDGGPATTAQLNIPTSVALDAAGNLFIADAHNHRIRKVTPDGIITTVAGTGTRSFSGDGGPATSASMSYPSSIAIDSDDNLFIADSGNSRIRKVQPDGTITTVAGTGVFGYSGDGGPATAAQFAAINGIAVDAAGNLFVSDASNHRIRKITFHNRPGLSAVGPEVGIPGSTITVTLSGANLFAPVAITAGNDIMVSDVNLTSDTTVTGTFSIASNAALGPRTVAVTTPLGTATAKFRVVPPFADLAVTSQSDRLAVGFDGVFTIDVKNVGVSDSSGPITLTDTLTAGLSYVSGAGTGWACSATRQIMNCTHDAPLAAGASTSLDLKVEVGKAASAAITHNVSVAVAGDEVLSNNSVSHALVVADPTPTIRLSPANPGRQGEIGLTLPAAFPHDVSGTLRLTFTPDAVNPSDDPAIQFATGGRQATFVIPANTLDAMFGTNVQAGPLGFQTGTVAGALAFDGVLQTGRVQIPLSSSLTIPRQAPVIESLLLDTTSGLEARLTLSSTPREVNQVILQFVTQPPVKPDCGSVAGCVTSRGALAFDVKSLFDAWYADDKAFGSVSTLRFPFSIQGSVQGSIVVTLRNNHGVSNSMSFPLP